MYEIFNVIKNILDKNTVIKFNDKTGKMRPSGAVCKNK